jgi:FkbM family methyltransferase
MPGLAGTNKVFLKYFFKKISALRFRIKCYSWGLFYGRSAEINIPKKILIGFSRKDINFVNRSDPRFRYEFIDICINDAYKLNSLSKGEIKTIVDIGANQGIFSLAARKVFSKAKIHAYEPNVMLSSVLSFNCKQVSAVCFYEAVTAQDCKVILQLSESDLETKVEQTEAGNVVGSSLKKVIDRAGGKIDLLKMDCEGGEWDLLQLKNEWRSIKYITMEYHLWHGKGYKIEELTSNLKNLGFNILSIKPVTSEYGMLLASNQNFAA